MGAKKAWAPEGVEVKPIVHLIDKDLDGNKPVYVELVKLKGVGWIYSHAVCMALGIDKWRKLGSLSEEELQKLEDCLRHPWKYGIPSWLYNRRRDPTTGQDLHLVGPDVDIAKQFDIKREIEIGSWRGFRHKEGLCVRGQKLRSHHRRFKRTVGVLRSRQARKELTEKMKQQAQQKEQQKKK